MEIRRVTGSVAEANKVGFRGWWERPVTNGTLLGYVIGWCLGAWLIGVLS